MAGSEAYASLIKAAVAASYKRVRSNEARASKPDIQPSDWDAAMDGAISYRKFRAVLFAAQRGLCGGCGKSLTQGGLLTNIDHVIPKAKGGSSDIENLLLMHARCNSAKGCGPASKKVMQRNNAKNAALKTIAAKPEPAPPA